MPAACRATCTTRVELALCLHSILNLDLYSQGWYAVRLSVQPCEQSDCLRITSDAQHTGRLGRKQVEHCPQLRYQSQKDGLRSELFLVRFIQQQISLQRTVSLTVEQLGDQDATDVECLVELELLYQPLVHPRSVEPPTELQLTCLATQTYHLAGLEQGLHAFQPVVFPSPNLAVLFLTVHSTALQQSLGTLTYRASDDIEGDLGLRLDACVSGAISQCWGGSPVQSGDHARRAQPTSHDSQFAQPRESDAAAARMGIHRPRQDPVSVTGEMLKNVYASKRTSSKHGSFGFDSFDNIGPEESEVLSRSGEPESKEGEGLPGKDPAETAVEVYARIRSLLLQGEKAANSKAAAGVVSHSAQCQSAQGRSAQALHDLLTGCTTSKSYLTLHLLRLKLLKPDDLAETPPAAQSAEAAAAASAADWACLICLLQTAPEDVVMGLKAQWQKQQVQEYTTWVRPAVELSSVRSKTAAKVVRQQLRDMSITSQSRPASTRPSITLPTGRSPLSIISSAPPSGLTHFSKAAQANSPSAQSPNKPNLAQPNSPWKLGPGATPSLHPTSPARPPSGLTLPPSPNSLSSGGVKASPGQRTSPSKGGLRWGAKWGNSRSPGQGGSDSSTVQSTDPSRNWGSGSGSPLVLSSSPSRNWEGSGVTPPVHSSSPSQHWIAAGGDSGVQSSSPSRFWGGAATPPVQSSAPSFLKGWLQKQRGHSVVEEQAMEAFRLQLALEAGQVSPSGPCILDQRLHTKPHHQPILFVDDSQAPNLQLPARPRSHLPSHGQIAASHAAVAGASYPNSNDSDQANLQQGLHGGSRGVERPAGKLGSSCDEAESISSSPRATPLRLMQQLISHGRGLSHASKHAGTAQEADSPSRMDLEAELLRQASSNSSAFSSSHMRVAGPSHGADSRFAAMRSLTRSAMSPRHATSLDSPAKLAVTRHRGTLAHNHQPSEIPGTHAKSPAGCNFDLDIKGLSPASSFGGSAGSSFTEGHHRGPSGSLAHLVSAPEAGSFADALAAAASFGDSALSPNSLASPSALLLAAAVLDNSAADSDDEAATSIAACEPAANDLSCLPTASHSISGGAAVQTAGKTQHVLQHPQDASQDTPAQGSANAQHADAASLMVDLSVAVSEGASKQLQQLPLSQDSLEFSVDSAYTAGLAEEASDSQQLLPPPSHTSTSLLGDNQAGLQHIGGPFSSLLEDRQTMPQDCSSQVTHRLQQRPLQQLGRSSASSESSQLLDQHDPGSSSDQSAAQLEQQSLLQLGGASALVSQDEQQPLLLLSDAMPLRGAELMAIGSADDKDPPSLPVAVGNADWTPPPLLTTTKGNADEATSPPLPIATGTLDAHRSAGCSGERQQGVARVLSKLPSLQSMTQRLRSHSQRVLQPVAQQQQQHPATVDEAEEDQTSQAAEQHDTEAHVVVFVHGFRGSARDLGAVRSHMQLAQPELDFLMSKSNQDRTAEGLQVMGHRLAQEVVHYLQEYDSGRHRRLAKLSFVGHSLGNLIIRAALTEPMLKAYLPSLWLFLSLSGPHLGYLCSANKLFCSGMWLFKKFTAGRTLHELTFTDAPELQDCYLHSLAAAPSFTLFRCVLLAASPQDQYVPFDSTRVQAPNVEHQGRRATAQREMARKLLHGADGTHKTHLIRVDVDFPVKQWKSVNNAVGRTAHLAFVESEAFLKFLVWSVLQPRQLI